MSATIEDIFISKGHKPFWKLIIPYGCFAFALYFIYGAWMQMGLEDRPSATEVLLGWGFLAFIFTIVGVYFGRVQDYHFDFLRKKYKKVQRVGFIGYGRWKDFKNLEYVSLFENLDLLYQINLWHDTNKHFDIDTFWNYDDAVEVAKDLATKLEIDFHNAVEQNAISSQEISNRSVKASDRQIDVHITQGRRAVWKTLLSLFFLLLGFAILLGFMESFSIETDQKRINFDLISLSFSGIMFYLAIVAAVVKDYQFDFKNDQFKLIYRIGPLRYGVWERLDSIDYISIYQYKEGSFQVNLWYNTNQRVNFKTYDDFDMALKVGKVLAKKLFVKVLDASDPHQTKWIET